MGNDKRMNETDQQAQRLLDLSLAFVNATHPLSSSHLAKTYYPSVAKNSFRKAFQRDREKLAICGLVIRRVNKQPDEPLWAVDEEASYAQTDALTPTEALTLDIALSPLASDRSFPYADDLRVALAKIDRSFGPDNVVRVSPEARFRGKVLPVAERCYAMQHAATMSYRREDGTTVERTIAIYGFFSLRDSTYVVAPQLGDTGLVIPDSIRTYRLDRFVLMREDKRISYVIPADFSVGDYVLLPFQMGPKLYQATFGLTDDALHRLGPSVSGRGELTKNNGSYVWHIDISSERDAAAWAIAEGLTPLGPASLRTTWVHLLGEAVAHA